MEAVLPNQSRIANLSDKHCIFRCGDSMFSLPATTVREVTMLPPIVTVPLSHPSLAGIGNVRSEFLPVINLAPLVGDQAQLNDGGSQLLVIESQLGGWSIAIDKVLAIYVIETHVDAETRNEKTLTVLLGTAAYDSKVISVLDVNELQRIAQQTLDSRWTDHRPDLSSTVNSSQPASE